MKRERETGLQTLTQSVHAGCIHTEAMSLFTLDVYTKKQCHTTSAHVFPCQRTRLKPHSLGYPKIQWCSWLIIIFPIKIATKWREITHCWTNPHVHVVFSHWNP